MSGVVGRTERQAGVVADRRVARALPPPAGRPGADVWVRRGCALVVAGVAAYASYEHQRRFALDGGSDRVSAGLWPLSVDGLMVLATLGLLSARADASRRVRWATRLAFGLGSVVSVAANVAAAPVLAWQPVVVAGWPPLALVLAIELLIHGPSSSETTETGDDRRIDEPEASSRLAGENRDERNAVRIPDSQNSREPEQAPPDSESSATDETGAARAALAHRVQRDNGSGQSSAEDRMWAYFQQEHALGRTPSGAELDWVAGTNSYGRAVLARWRRSGRIAAGADLPNGAKA